MAKSLQSRIRASADLAGASSGAQQWGGVRMLAIFCVGHSVWLRQWRVEQPSWGTH